MTRATLLIATAATAAAVLLLPMAASAQSPDAAYCSALVEKYERYVDTGTRRVQAPANVDAKIAVEKCKAGDTAGIATLEKALKDARLDLPPRG